MIKHFIEIKNRVIIVMISYLFLVFTFYHYSYFLLILSVFLNQEVIKNNILNYFIFTSLNDLFFIYIKLTLSFSNYVTFFIIVYHLISFLKPGLYRKEFFYLKVVFKINLIFNILFIYLYNNYVLSAISSFFFDIYLNKTYYINLFFEANICEYFSFYKETFFDFCMYFQILISGFILINYLNLKVFKKIKKIVYFFILMISTIITPPDIFNQILCFSILIFLFEINLFVCVLMQKFNQVNN